MLAKNTKSIKKSRRLLSQFMRPNIIRYIELDKLCRTHSKLIRVVISKTPNGLFETGIMRVGHKMDIYSTAYTPDVGVYDQRYFADEKLEELVTVAEQEGFEFSDEFDGDIVDVCSKRYQSTYPLFSESSHFYNQHREKADDFFCQSIPSGLHVLIKIDAFGEMCVHDFHSENTPIAKENLIVGRVKTYLQPLMQRDGFRGALMEAYFDGISVFIVDAGYLHDKSLFNTPFEKRCVVINNILASMEQSDGCRFIYPTKGNACDWINTYRFGLKKAALVKHGKGLFCVQPSNRFEKVCKMMDPGTLLSESNKASFIGNKVESGELLLSMSDNIRSRTTVPYPSKVDIVRPNEYSVIGYDEMITEVPVIF
jgi:hypothetical protein